MSFVIRSTFVFTLHHFYIVALSINLLSNIYYTQDKLFETPGSKRIFPQHKFVLIEMYVYFGDITELGDTYSRSVIIESIRSYLVER